MANDYRSPIAEALADSPEATSWYQAAALTLEARRPIITKDVAGEYDLTNPDHVRLQLAWAESAQAEAESRRVLLDRLVDPQWPVLEPLGKSALVASLSRFETQGQPAASLRIIKSEGQTRVAGIRNPNKPISHHGTRIPLSKAPVSGPDRVFWQADQIVGAVSDIADALHVGAVVTVTETEYWEERRSGRFRSYNQGMCAEISSRLVLDSMDGVFEVLPPTITDEGNTNLGLPEFMKGLTVQEVTASTDRDFGMIDDGLSYSKIMFDNTNGHADVPAVPVQYAIGRDVSPYIGDADITSRRQHTFSMSIDDVNISMPPRRP